MTVDLALIGPMVAAALTAGASAIVTYAAMRRSKSGRINSSEADVLWTESTALRRELREQVQALEKHIQSNEVEIAGLRSENAALKHEVLMLRQENAALKIQVDAVKVENVDLRATQTKQQEREGAAL